MAMVRCDPAGTAIVSAATPPTTRRRQTRGVRLSRAAPRPATPEADRPAPDAHTARRCNVPRLSGSAADERAVPAGSHRTIAMRAYDAEGVETHSGSVELSVVPGMNPTVTLVMHPLNGDVPITVTLGSVAVTVTPTALVLAVGDTARLAVSIKDWNGTPMAGTARWATHDPGIVAVDDAGLVTAVHAGSTTVTATFEGAGGRATVTVTP